MKPFLFVTCLVDQLFPEVGIGLVKVLQRLGIEILFPPEQTCCGQLAFNNGFWQKAKILAKRFISTFEQADAIIIPSGSCTSMIKIYYPILFKDDPDLLLRAQAVGVKVYEFSEFLVKVLGIREVGAAYNGRVTYHDSCHLLQELRIYEEPRKLLASVKGIKLIEMENSAVCCGFGGIFSIKNHEISKTILRDKINKIIASGAEAVVANDIGCLMHIAGGLSRQNIPLRTLHLAQVLASV
jgi:L-lactate dehydrogenase complex protein LldE